MGPKKESFKFPMIYYYLVIFHSWKELRTQHFKIWKYHWKDMTTVFLHIVSAETILFLNLEMQRLQYISQRSQYLNVRKLFKGGNSKIYISIILYALLENVSTHCILAVHTPTEMMYVEVFSSVKQQSFQSHSHRKSSFLN